jgi:hypothetical protein
MQHLPQLAMVYAFEVQHSKLTVKNIRDGSDCELEDVAGDQSHFQVPEHYSREFRNQVLDFIATNPPRFGVNWRCTMDVAIRIANWLVAYDIFRAHGMQFDEDFEKVFKRSIYEHGFHIINNMEWSEEFRSNHYLSNIAGLLFVAAYLPRSPEIDAWLAFTVQELIKEVQSQFYPDGGNFEASTSYHRLAAEIVTYATALIMGLPEHKLNALKDYDHTLINEKPVLSPSPLPYYNVSVRSSGKSNQSQKSKSPFPLWYFERLEKMAEFTMHITKPDGHVPQIGDNDSGRFFKFRPVYKTISVAQAKKIYSNLEGYDELPDEAVYWDEDFLDHRHLVAAINGLFDREDFTDFAEGIHLETNIIRHLASGICLASYKRADEPAIAENVGIKISNSEWNKLKGKLETVPENRRPTMKLTLPDGATNNIKLFAYPDFGLYVYRSKRFYLSIRCGPVGQNGNGGHAHNDQLSIELNVDGKDWITDPGTYLYTPLPERRNEYRSVKVHFSPQLEKHEPGNMTIGTFVLGGDPKAEVIFLGSREFIGKHVGYGIPVYRHIIIQDTEILITDFFFNNDSIPQYPSMKMPFSPAYGKRLQRSI